MPTAFFSQGIVSSTSGEDMIFLRVGLMPPLVRFPFAATLALAEDRRPLISLWTYIFVCQSTLKGSRMLFVLRWP